MRSDDPSGLGRFLSAQGDGTYERALAELRAGRKSSHWMWFVFPQLAGLGRSAMAQHYAIGTLDEARAYLVDPVLGPRLRECTDAMLAADDAERVLGRIDAIKLRSSLTLFELAAPDDPRYGQALDKLYAAERDDATLRLLAD